MERLWAPWRMEYITREKTDECIFCTLPKAGDDDKNFILYKSSLSFVIMNTFPYNTGHIMVSTYRHLSCVTLLEEKELNEMNLLTQKSIEILRKINSPDGFNIGLNIGKAAGAGFDEHIHTHIVPRWNGDTNFMPVMAEIKVYPEHLRKTFETMQPHFKKLSL